jgi:uncharacterized membrane-anchored protein YhcB (DUF1043 family)
MRWFWAVLVFGVAVGVLVGYQIARWQKTPTEVDLKLPAIAAPAKSATSLSEAFVKVGEIG